MNQSLEKLIPVTIITGFLGSGKTTLLNYILSQQEGLKIALLVNEFGEIGIDNQLIVATEDNVVELNNGCICCTINQDLIESVNKILQRDQQVDYLIVETTGVADPLPVALTFVASSLKAKTRLDSIVTLADCENFSLDRFPDNKTAINQFVCADVVVLNKIDLVDSLLGDVIAHAVLPGLAIAFYLGIDIFLGAFISGILSTFIIAWIKEESKIKIDVAMALVFSGFLALGIMLITLLKSKIDLHSFLFGDILVVTESDVLRTLIITFFVFLFINLFYKELLFYTFNTLGAKAIGLPVKWLNLMLVSAITLAIIASMQAVGVVLVVSLLIAPSITAYLLVKELSQMMIVGAIIDSISGVIGIYLSYYLNVPSGASIVIVASILFLLALLFSPSQGILTRPEMLYKIRHIFNRIIKN